MAVGNSKMKVKGNVSSRSYSEKVYRKKTTIVGILKSVTSMQHEIYTVLPAPTRDISTT